MGFQLLQTEAVERKKAGVRFHSTLQYWTKAATEDGGEILKPRSKWTCCFTETCRPAAPNNHFLMCTCHHFVQSGLDILMKCLDAFLIYTRPSRVSHNGKLSAVFLGGSSSRHRDEKHGDQPPPCCFYHQSAQLFHPSHSQKNLRPTSNISKACFLVLEKECERVSLWCVVPNHKGSDIDTGIRSASDAAWNVGSSISEYQSPWTDLIPCDLFVRNVTLLLHSSVSYSCIQLQNHFTGNIVEMARDLCNFKHMRSFVT